MPTCRNCSYSQNVGRFIDGLCDNCRLSKNEISNYQREEIVLNNQITQLQTKLNQYLTQRKQQIQQEIELLRGVLS